VESLTALRQKGKAELLAAPKVVTQSGLEATVKGVTEMIYPTEFCAAPVAGTNTNTTATAADAVVEPGGFETREVGAILTVLATVTPESRLISLTLAPQLVFEPEWRDYGYTCTNADGSVEVVHMEQPFFHSESLQTSVLVNHTETVLLGGGMPSKDPEKVVYMFVTARLIGTDGKPLKKRETVGSER